MSNCEHLSNIFFDASHPAGFSSCARLAEASKTSLKKVKTFLEHQDTFTKHKAVRHQFKRRKIVVPTIDYLWQCDLITVKNLARKNRGFHYLLTVIDVLSRHAWVRPVHRKTATLVTNAFSDILSNTERRPKFVQCDEGKYQMETIFTTFHFN
jgi:hypothetical protein